MWGIQEVDAWMVKVQPDWVLGFFFGTELLLNEEQFWLGGWICTELVGEKNRSLFVVSGSFLFVTLQSFRSIKLTKTKKIFHYFSPKFSCNNHHFR